MDRLEYFSFACCKPERGSWGVWAAKETLVEMRSAGSLQDAQALSKRTSLRDHWLAAARSLQPTTMVTPFSPSALPRVEKPLLLAYLCPRALVHRVYECHTSADAHPCTWLLDMGTGCAFSTKWDGGTVGKQNSPHQGKPGQLTWGTWCGVIGIATDYIRLPSVFLGGVREDLSQGGLCIWTRTHVYTTVTAGSGHPYIAVHRWTRLRGKGLKPEVLILQYSNPFLPASLWPSHYYTLRKEKLPSRTMHRRFYGSVSEGTRWSSSTNWF